MLRNPGLRKSVEQPVLDLNFAASQIGSNAAPDSRIDFSRGTNAWFVDSDGLVKKSPHNLVLYSEDFSDSSYQKSGVTATDNAISSPFGDLTGALIAETSATANHNLNYFFTVNPDETFTVSYFVKKAGRDVLSLQNYGPGSISGGQYANFDYTFSTNSFGTAGTGGNTTLVARSATDFGNGWVRIQISLTFSGGTSGNGSWRIYANNGSATSYAGDTTKGFYLFGAQISQHTTLPVDNPYIKTTGSAVYAARLDHDPVTNTPKGLLIEEARTNLITDSEDFTGSQFNAVRVTNTANSSIAPDGTNTATEVVPSTDNNTHLIRWDDSVISGTTYTASVFVKQASGDANIRLLFNNTNSGFDFSAANFDLSAGTVNNLSCNSASIEEYGNGWFRCSVTEAATASVTGRIQLNVMDSSNNNSYAGDDTTGIFIWGFQIEEGSFPTSYIKTTGSAATRNADVAVMGPTTGGTELVVNGTFDTATDWTLSAGWSITGGEAVASSAAQFRGISSTALSLVAGRRYRASMDVASYTAGSVDMRYREGGSIIANTGNKSSTGTFTLDFTCTDAASPDINIQTRSSGSNTFDIDNVSVRELYPFEQYNPAEGTVVCEFERFGTGSFDRIWELTDNRSGNINQNLMGLLTLNSTSVYFVHFKGGVSSGLDFQSIGVSQGEKNITAYAYQHNNFHISSATNGVLEKSFEDTSCEVPPVDILAIGNPTPLSSNFSNSHIKRLTYFPYRLANDVCDSKVSS